MTILKLAYRNLKGAGIRTWLNVFVLSLAFVAIIYLQGMYIGMQDQSIRISENTALGSGQFWCDTYDPYDPLTIQDAHAPIPPVYDDLISSGEFSPILLYPASIYPDNRRQSVLLRGVIPEQTVLELPTAKLAVTPNGFLPMMLGKRMARSTKTKVGDIFTVQWRDANGAYDAIDGQIVHIMDTENATIDAGQVWVSLPLLQDITRTDNQASFLVVDKNFSGELPDKAWRYFSLYDLTADIRKMVEMKSAGGSILYGVLMALALLAIFDTQVLAMWKRRKEMGTLMALGMTRGKLIGLFTLEGSLYGIFAGILAALYGGPLLYLQWLNGFPMPEIVDDFGMVFPRVIYPAYTSGLILGTIAIVMTTVIIISYIPVRKLAKLKPTDALRGKLS